MARILVIDDEIMILELVRRALVDVGHEVTTVDDGDRAPATLEVEPFDLVITDILMPGREGIGLILEIRRRFAALPVVAVSGGMLDSGQDILDMAQRLGAVRALAKPFRPRQLVDLVATCLAEDY